MVKKTNNFFFVVLVIATVFWRIKDE